MMMMMMMMMPITIITIIIIVLSIVIITVPIIVIHRLPDGVRTNVSFYRSAMNSHNNAIIMSSLRYIAALLRKPRLS